MPSRAAEGPGRGRGGQEAAHGLPLWGLCQGVSCSLRVTPGAASSLQRPRSASDLWRGLRPGEGRKLDTCRLRLSFLVSSTRI